MDVIQDIPGYKVILKAVLRTQIQQLVEQLAEYTDEESVILTASAADGTISHLGSDYGRRYLDTYEDVKKTFLGFCLQKNHGNDQTAQNLSSHANIAKIQTKVVEKSRHSPYRIVRPHSNKGPIEETFSVLSKNGTDRENSGESSSQSKTAAEKLNQIEFLEVIVKEEPIDDSYERGKSSEEGASNNKPTDSDGMLGNGQATKSVWKKSELNETSDSVNIPFESTSNSDSILDSSQQSTDNSGFISDTTEVAGLPEGVQGQPEGVGLTNRIEKQLSKDGGRGNGQNDCKTTLCHDEPKKPPNDEDTSDTEIYDDSCSRDDSIKDYLSEDENKVNATSNDLDIAIHDTLKENSVGITSSENGSSMKRHIEMSADHVDVMQICLQTIDQLTKCVARAISEERKHDGDQHQTTTEKHNESAVVVTDLKNKTDEEQDVQNLGEEEICEKSYKVLATWNEITNDVNEARNEVLYDLIADKLKQENLNQECLHKSSLIGDKAKAPVNHKNETQSVQTELSSKATNIATYTDNQTGNVKLRERSTDCVRATQDVLYTDINKESSEPRMLTHSSESQIQSNSSNVDTHRVDTFNKCTEREANNEYKLASGEITDGTQTESRNTDNTPAVDSVKKTLADQNIAHRAIDVETVSIKETETPVTKTIELTTPVKLSENKQTGNTPKQQKNVPSGGNKSQSKTVTPNKPSKHFIDSLISKGVPIIIPDDDDDEDEVMPSPRSSAFEIKSRQYHDEMERKSRGISNMAKLQQSYGTYAQQTPSYLNKSTPPTQPYKQYSPQMQHQYQYDDYYSQQQYGYQQAETREFTSPKQSVPSRQHLFTPPKNVINPTRLHDVSPNAGQMKSHVSPRSHHVSPSSLQTPPKASPYFKHGYVTPTKQQEMMHHDQYRRQNTQSSLQQSTLQQRTVIPTRVKQNMSSGTTIVIDDAPTQVTRKEPPATVNQSQKQMQTYVVKQPALKQNLQHTSVSRPVTQAISPSPTMQHFVQPQQQGPVDKALQSSMTLPVISNVASVSTQRTDSNAYAQMQLMKELQQTFPSSDTDSGVIRQSNERTPVKRTRSDDTVTENRNVSEPSNKRRHTSADEYGDSSRRSISPSKSHTDQDCPGQISPSKIPPKLEIDIDDVPGVLPEPSNQMPILNSPPVLHQTDRKSKEDRPIIPISPQLARTDIVSFSPPVSPSTRRLHAAPVTRSKTPVGTTTSALASDSDNSSGAPQESVAQTKKMFGCGDCGKSYTTKAALNQHFRKHTQERPFECDVCGKHYSQKGYLKKHILTHFKTQEK